MATTTMTMAELYVRSASLVCARARQRKGLIADIDWTTSHWMLAFIWIFSSEYGKREQMKRRVCVRTILSVLLYIPRSAFYRLYECRRSTTRVKYLWATILLLRTPSHWLPWDPIKIQLDLPDFWISQVCYWPLASIINFNGDDVDEE